MVTPAQYSHPYGPHRPGTGSRPCVRTAQVARSLAASVWPATEPVVYTQGMALSGRLTPVRLDPTRRYPVCVWSNRMSLGRCRCLTPLLPRLPGRLIWGCSLPKSRAIAAMQTWSSVWQSAIAQARMGRSTPSDPDYRTEDMFMNGAMLGRAFWLSGEMRYVDLLTRFLLTAHTQQEDGLFWHSRSTPYYWGRGNGFALLGFSETLSFSLLTIPIMPCSDMHVRHLAALRQVPAPPSGMFGQVLNVSGSYQEFTVTCDRLRHGAGCCAAAGSMPRIGISLDLAWRGDDRAHRRRGWIGGLLHQHWRAGEPTSISRPSGDFWPR